MVVQVIVAASFCMDAYPEGIMVVSNRLLQYIQLGESESVDIRRITVNEESP
jgi:hypothetical protein